MQSGWAELLCTCDFLRSATLFQWRMASWPLIITAPPCQVLYKDLLFIMSFFLSLEELMPCLHRYTDMSNVFEEHSKNCSFNSSSLCFFGHYLYSKSNLGGHQEMGKENLVCIHNKVYLSIKNKILLFETKFMKLGKLC